MRVKYEIELSAHAHLGKVFEVLIQVRDLFR